MFQSQSATPSWGRVVRAPSEVARPRWADELAAAIALAPLAPNGGLAAGLGRSYGDSGLNPGGRVIAMAGLDRIHAFDPQAGLLRADAGFSLDAAIRLALPHGLFPPVVPGTKFVTLGGAVANDVHGKNHHLAGAFGRHVTRLRLRRTDGAVHDLGPGDPLFAATVGGLGLTGVIEWVELRLSRVAGGLLDNEDIPFGSLGDFFALAAESEATHAHTVAWVDCTGRGRGLGRGIFSRAGWSDDPDRTLHAAPRLSLPLDAPSFALNPLTLKAFNTAFYATGRMRAGRRRAHYEQVFFPLDAIGGWNRLYGPRGFYQHQCVIPEPTGRDAVAALLEAISRSGQGSFLAVLKTMGDQPSPGLMSFPMKGVTLALDFPNRGGDTLRLLERLDAIVVEAGGRLYPAKDGRMSPAVFAAGYPALDTFLPHLDPGLSSGFWRRVRP
ncbi:MAG: FAD-dependent oxidoreductase [Phenylobacterium sp.]|uniref:FAD-binding oxidoreductase n=1 Tax=Phenylobacterium sp. TaxID=1871053 RepID=UPI00391B8979